VRNRRPAEVETSFIKRCAFAGARALLSCGRGVIAAARGFSPRPAPRLQVTVEPVYDQATLRARVVARRTRRDPARERSSWRLYLRISVSPPKFTILMPSQCTTLAISSSR